MSVPWCLPIRFLVFQTPFLLWLPGEGFPCHFVFPFPIWGHCVASVLVCAWIFRSKKEKDGGRSMHKTGALPLVPSLKSDCQLLWVSSIPFAVLSFPTKVTIFKESRKLTFLLCLRHCTTCLLNWLLDTERTGCSRIHWLQTLSKKHQYLGRPTWLEWEGSGRPYPSRVFLETDRWRKLSPSSNSGNLCRLLQSWPCLLNCQRELQILPFAFLQAIETFQEQWPQAIREPLKLCLHGTIPRSTSRQTMKIDKCTQLYLSKWKCTDESEMTANILC